MSDAQSENAAVDEAPEGIACDFCGKVVPQVRRVALDRDYERLQTRHEVQYACPDCSKAKEQGRQGDGAA